MSAGERIAERGCSLRGSYSFIIAFTVALVVYRGINVWLGKSPGTPYPLILLNLLLSVPAASGSSDHNEPEPPGQPGPGCSASWIMTLIAGRKPRFNPTHRS